jgi:hypothetical protein
MTMTDHHPCRQCGTTTWHSLTDGICDACRDRADFEEALARGLIIVQISTNRHIVVRLPRRATVAGKHRGAGISLKYLTGEEVFRGGLAECKLFVSSKETAP